MPRPPSANDDKFLRLLHDLRLGDLEMLTPLLSTEKDGKPVFGLKGIERASERLFERGYIHRLWKHRDPKFRFDRGSRRKVFILSEQGCLKLGLTPDQVRAERRRYETLKNPRTEYRIDHELMIGRIHAALIVASEKQSQSIRLAAWHQGEGTRIEGDGFSLTPDAMFQIVSETTRRAGWFFLEADTGNERLESDDDSRRTIIKKVRRYGQIDRDEVAQEQFRIPGFSVLFLAPRRAGTQLSGREQGILDVLLKAGMLRAHAPKFYRVMSETDVVAALHNPAHFLEEPCLRTIGASGEINTSSFVPSPLHEKSPSGYASAAEPIA